MTLRQRSLTCLLLAMFAAPCAAQSTMPGALQLRTESWRFDAASPAHSALSSTAARAEFAPPADATAGFTLQLTIESKPFTGEKTVLQIDDVLSVRLRQHGPRGRKRQNYPAYKLPDGSVPVLEATLRLDSGEHPDWKEMTIGVPLAMLPGTGRHEAVLNFSGVRWTMYVDGQLVDNDFPFGYPKWNAKNAWNLDAAYVVGASLRFPASIPQCQKAPQPTLVPVQYWTPPGHNAWVGDVVSLFHNGRYHIFYLYDRRHHQSKFGKGAHYFEHLSTTDLKTWTEHEAATPLDEQWECIGTGTPFAWQGQLCLAYGLHTGRIYPDAKTTWPAQREYLQKHGQTGEFRRADTPGVPAGSTYSISADGVANFAKTQIMFHPCQNPSVYVDPLGKLRMLANAGGKGIWESAAINGGWRCLRPDFPPGGDCTFFFRWGRFDYIIGGFKNLWRKPIDAPDTAYADVVSQSLDCYDGLNVPAISEIAGGRFLMAGWTTLRGWGGNLVIRELLQLPDGQLGSKWLPEIMPATDAPRPLAGEAIATGLNDNQSYLLTLRVEPARAGQGRLGLVLLPESGEQAACEFQLHLGEGRAQFGPGLLGRYADQQKSLREGGAPQGAGNYAIERLVGVDRPFDVRIIVHSNGKLGGSLIDAEIAGQRTMLTYRPDLAARRLLFRAEGVTLSNVQIARLKDY